MSDARENESRPLDIMQKARLARGGRGAIEPVGTTKFSDAAAVHSQRGIATYEKPEVTDEWPLICPGGQVSRFVVNGKEGVLEHQEGTVCEHVQSACGNCGEVFPQPEQVRQHIKQEHRGLDKLTTRQLLDELQLRGDLAMVAMPTSARGQDGCWISSVVGMLFTACNTETLDARRGE